MPKWRVKTPAHDTYEVVADDLVVNGGGLVFLKEIARGSARPVQQVTLVVAPMAYITAERLGESDTK